MSEAVVFISQDMLNLQSDGRYAVEIENPLVRSYEGLPPKGTQIPGPGGTVILGKCQLSINSFGTIEVRNLGAIGSDEKFEKQGNLLVRRIGDASFVIPVA